MTNAKQISMYPVLPDETKGQSKKPAIKGGYFIVARCIQNSSIAHAVPHIREIWYWLLKEANHREHKTHGRVIKRGQVFTGYEEIQEGLHWFVGFIKNTYKRHHVDYAMRWLRQESMITTEKTTRGLIITICNYDSYQNPTNYDNDNDYDTDYDDQTPRLRQPSATIHKKDKEERKKKKDSTGPIEFVFSHNGFFDRQIEANKDKPEIEKYKNLVEFLHGLNGSPLRFDNVLSLSKQISFKDYLALKETEKTSDRTIKKVLESMENKAGLKKDYNNVFLTVNNWLQNKFN